MIKLVKTELLSVALLATVVAKASKIAQGETLSVIDTNGEVLLAETLKKSESYIKTINFSPLDEGVYFLETRKEKEVNVTPIFVKNSSVSIAPNLTKTYKAPKITLNGTLANILVKNFDKSFVKISVYDKDSKEIVLESNKNLLIYRSFDFEILGPGTYTISVTQNDYNFTKEVTF